MKRFLLGVVVLLIFSAPGLAAPTLEFSGTGGASVSGWSFADATDTFSFGKPLIGAVEGAFTDPLAGGIAYADIPDMVVGGSPGNWTLAGGTIRIRAVSDDQVLMQGTLGVGKLLTSEPPLGTTAAAYPVFKTDITVTSVDNSGLSSPALARIANVGKLDFDLTLAGGPKAGFEEMLKGNVGDWSDGLSGSMSVVPAPGAILLSGLGVAGIGWMRRRRAL